MKDAGGNTITGRLVDLINERTKGGTEYACPFCDTNLKERSFTLSTNSVFAAVFSKYPVTEGHTLIVPLCHVEQIHGMPKAHFLEGWEFAHHVAKALQVMDPTITGANIGINIGASAGQTIAHAHIHVIPRRDGDCEDPRGGVRRVLANDLL